MSWPIYMYRLLWLQQSKFCWDSNCHWNFFICCHTLYIALRLKPNNDNKLNFNFLVARYFVWIYAKHAMFTFPKIKTFPLFLSHYNTATRSHNFLMKKKLAQITFCICFIFFLTPTSQVEVRCPRGPGAAIPGGVLQDQSDGDDRMEAKLRTQKNP